nr:hypothetical protein [Nonlabens sp. Hel1_33_55]
MTNVSFVDIIWCGVATISIMAGIWSLFSGLDFWFVGLVVLLSSISVFVVQSEIRSRFTDVQKNISGWTFSKWIWSIIVILLVLATGTLSGYVLDNDSYYIQTIKWLDEYGLVYGIANWHLFLAQQSGFHILEAGLNLEFLNLNLNDLGSFLTLVMMLWSLVPNQDEKTLVQKAFRNFLAIIMPLLLLLGTAPSPDVPVILLSYYIVYKFLFLPHDWKNIFMISLLTALACYFKITMVFLGLFPLFMILKLEEHKWKSIVHLFLIGLVFGGLFLVKNSIASGYPLFPLTFISWNVDWLVPMEMLQFFTDATMAQAYGVSFYELNGLNISQRLLLWFNHAGMEGWLNKGLLLVIVACVAGAIYHFRKPRLAAVFWVFIFFAVALAISSPQARFFLPLAIPAAIALCIYSFKSLRKYSLVIARVGIISSALLLVLPSIISSTTDNQRMKNVPKFELANLLVPAQKSRYNSAFAKARINNINYYNPTGDDFFYGSFDVPLPAAQSEYLEYFQTNYFASPEYRGDSPASGFRAVKN